jgi:hypothetical protein
MTNWFNMHTNRVTTGGVPYNDFPQLRMTASKHFPSVRGDSFDKYHKSK